MQRVHIIGGKNHGKTTLIEELIRELQMRGLRVGTIKHTHHDHELDTPGKDSYRHRQAGAAVVGIVSKNVTAAFVTVQPGATTNEARYQALEPLFATCDVVLVEGDMETTAAKLEVWRAALGTPPRAASDSRVLAVISDDQVPANVPVLPRSDLTGVVDWILTHCASCEHSRRRTPFGTR